MNRIMTEFTIISVLLVARALLYMVLTYVERQREIWVSTRCKSTVVGMNMEQLADSIATTYIKGKARNPAQAHPTEKISNP